ncbi:hypothetical protein HPB47_010541, partial [Ixodes persulcatus]
MSDGNCINRGICSIEVIPIHADIEDRLAKLKGVDVSYYRQAPITGEVVSVDEGGLVRQEGRQEPCHGLSKVYKDNRTDAEKASDLFKQTMGLVAIDIRRTNVIKASVDEMESRLARLRSTEKDPPGEAEAEPPRFTFPRQRAHRGLESHRREQNQRCKGRRRANTTDDDCATEAKRKREARRRLHSTPAEQFAGATARFRREFVENLFGVTCAVATDSVKPAEGTRRRGSRDEVARLIGRELKAATEAAKAGLADLQKDEELMAQLRAMETKKSATSKGAEEEGEESDDSGAAADIVAQILEESRLEELEVEEELGLPKPGE